MFLNTSKAEKSQNALQLPPRAAELLCSRLCHELISPVGAINNGVELIQELGDEVRGDAMALITSSGKTAATRLMYYRLAYGAAGSENSLLWEEIQKAVSDFFEGSRIVISWNEDMTYNGTELYDIRGLMKVLLNVLVLAADVVQYRGTLMISPTVPPTGSKAALSVKAKGEKVVLREDYELALDGKLDQDDLDPRNIHTFMTRHFAETFGITLKHSVTEGESAEFILAVRG